MEITLYMMATLFLGGSIACGYVLDKSGYNGKVELEKLDPATAKLVRELRKTATRTKIIGSAIAVFLIIHNFEF